MNRKGMLRSAVQITGRTQLPRAFLITQSPNHLITALITQSPPKADQPLVQDVAEPNHLITKVSFVRSLRGQSVLEYVILMIAVILAVTGLRSYARYAIQGRLEDARMTILDQASPYDAKQGADAFWMHRADLTERNAARLIEAPPTTDPLGVAAARESVESTVSTSFQETTHVDQHGR